MAQISYGTITITDTTDIERIYPVYCKGGEITAPALEPLSNWSEVVSQAGGTGDYIWQRIVTKKQNITVTINDYSDAVRLTGDDGAALTIIQTQYAQTQNENDTPSYGNSMPSSINEGWWLWVKTIYSDNSEVVIKTKQGQKGDQGYSVTNTRELYYLKTNSTTVPQITNSNQITNTDRQNGWTSIVPSYVTNGNYYTCIETTLNSPTNNLKWSAPVINNALTDTNKKASEAYDATVARDTEINALKATAKYYWWDSEGAHIASGLTSTDSDTNINHSTPDSFGYNALMAPGYLALRYQDKKFMQLSTNSLIFYKPKIESSTFVQGNKAMELSSSGLVFYDGSAANGGNIQAQFGSSGAIQSGNYQRGNDSKFSVNGTKIDLTAGDIITQYFRLSQGGESGGPSAGAYIHGSLEALSGRIGGFLDDGSASANYWDIGNFTDYNLQRSAKIIGHGSSFIQLDNDDLTWRLANNRIHTGWYQPSTDSYLHFPEFTIDGSDTAINKRRWDYGIHVPTSYNDKFLYIRTASIATDLSNLVQDLDDKAINPSWTYKFWIDGSGNVYAPNLYKLQNGQWTAVDAGGAVDSASKLSSYGGSSTQPVYFPSTGVPTAVSWDVKTTLNNKNDEVPTSAAVKTFVEGKGYITSYTETDPTVPSWAKATTKPSYALSEITDAEDVKAIEALTDTSGLLKKTATNTWTLDTNTYLTSYTETDPIFVASAAHGITSSDISNWNSKTSNTGTVTKVTAGTGLKIGTTSSSGDITTTGTINHINSVTAKTAAAQSAKTLTWGGTFTLYEEKYDAQGHVTDVASYNMTMPANPNTHNTAYLYAGKSDGIVNAATTNGNTYLILMDGGSATTRRKISGSGTVSVASDANGNITITGSTHPTSLPNPKSLKLKVYSGTTSSADTTYYGGETNNTEVSVAGATAITGISASAAAGGSTTFTLTKANGTTSTFDVTVTASVATGATKLTDSSGNTISEGSATNPVYFSAGVPVATTYSLNKTVPSNAVFTDTWNAMVGATSSANGTAGYVSAPPKDGYNTKFLRADGTWVVPGGTYSLPLAADGTRGGVQIGYSANGKNYPVQLSSEKMYVNVPWTDTNYYHKTGSWNGLTYTAGKVGNPDDLAFTLPTGTTSTTILRGDHTYATSIEKDTSTTTSQLTLAYGTKYKLTTGGTNYIFTMPASDNTNTTYVLSGTLSSHKFTSTLTAGGSGSGTSTSDFTLAAGDNITLTDNTSTRTITIKATDTTYESKAAASGGTAVSLVTTGEKYTWNNKQDKLTNPVTGTGNSGYLVKWNGSTSVTNGPQLGSSTTTYLRNDGSWGTPPNTDTKVKLTLQSTSGTYPLIFGPASITSGNDYEAYYNTGITANPNTSTLKATNIETVYLKATNAKVTNILEANEVHTNKWTAANIANIGGSFYISPTMESDVTGITISVSSDIYTFRVTGGTFSTSAANVNWKVGSRVMATGTITKGNVEYPIGTIVGILNTINSSSFTINNIASSNKGTLDKISAASGSYGTSHVQISMYQIGDGNTSSSTFKPVGILLTSYGVDKNGQGTGDTSLDTFIDIYGGTNVIGTNAGIGGVDPNVRLGYLGHLNPYNYYPSLDTSVNTRKAYYTLSNNIYTKVTSPSGNPASKGYYEAIQPEGWGLYTDNGYFKGTIVANDGRIGSGAAAWSIGNDGDNRAYIYSKNNSITATTVEGMYVGTDGILNVSSANTSGRPYVQIRNGIITAQGANINGAITATSLTIGTTDVTNYAGDIATISYKASINAEFSVEIITSNFKPAATSGNLVTLTAKVTRVGNGSISGIKYQWFGDGDSLGTASTSATTYNVPYNTPYKTFTVEIS